jgi:hypothetical protein
MCSCAATSFPQFPEEIKNHYLVEVKNEIVPKELEMAILNPDEIPLMFEGEIVRCLKFDIVEHYPYKIKFVAIEALAECNAVGGYKPKNMKSLLNWIDNVYVWAEDRKKCFRK